jgi:hypothetical protein
MEKRDLIIFAYQACEGVPYLGKKGVTEACSWQGLYAAC